MAIEKRRQKRTYCSGSVYYSCWDEGGEHAKVKMARCTDVSGSGMCIFTKSEIKPGALVKVHSYNRKKLNRVASARWVEKLDKDLFRVGLHYH